MPRESLPPASPLILAPLIDMYSLAGYGEMIADRVRVKAYAEALRRTVKPGSVVMDIGTGPGIWAVLACELGASRVFALEPDSIIQVAREVAVSNRCSGQIEFAEKMSTRFELPVQADVIVSDLRGVLPLAGKNIPSVVDARQRFLAPQGLLIPRRDTVWAAVVQARQSYRRLLEPWKHNILKQDLSAARQRSVNTPQKAQVKPAQLLSKPKLWTTVDYATIEGPDVQGGLDWTVESNGIGHGILVWFDADLSDGVGFSNAPGAPKTIYGSLFFPWLEPVSLVAGQSVSVKLVAKLVEDDYVWRWTTCIEPANGTGNSRIHFEQSSLQGDVISLQALQKQASDHIPHLSDEGHIHRRILEMIDGRASLEDIARRLAAEFPARFTRWQQALSYVGSISQKLGE
jgi:type I protein arginine methyltransferase